jgi:UDP-N-acetylmuramyl tripeptide synthase
MTDTTGRAVRLQLDAASFAVDGLGELATRLTGAYNVTNALAAIGVARVLGVAPDAIRRGLASTGPAFGRQENVDFGGRALHLLLTKNPAGANEVIRLLAAVAPPEGLQVAALLNNRFADGQDVSWIWDVDYEAIASRVTRCWTAGDRAEDMALRLTYARWPAPDAVMRTAAELLDAMAATAEARQHLFVIPTYTAMLELRAELVRRGFAQPFWE